MEKQKINLKITNTYVIHGNYEGHDYYQIVAETSDGFQLKTKLTAFEYGILVEPQNGYIQ